MESHIPTKDFKHFVIFLKITAFKLMVSYMNFWKNMRFQADMQKKRLQIAELYYANIYQQSVSGVAQNYAFPCLFSCSLVLMIASYLQTDANLSMLSKILDVFNFLTHLSSLYVVAIN